METEDETPAEIQLLPHDIIILVLEYTSITDIVRFGSTCKQFNDLVKSFHGLWKLKLRNTVNGTVFSEIQKYCDGNWFNEVKKYTSLQSAVHGRIIDMAGYYYRCNCDVNLYDVRQFHNHAYLNGLSYYCTIDILQGFLKKASQHTFLRFGNKPFTLTEMRYTKIALRHFLHPYLSMKWVQAQVRCELPPEFVLNFFIQWVDPLKLHTDEEVTNALNSLENMVEALLMKMHPSTSATAQEMCAKGQITESQIIAAISHVIYKGKRMTPVSVANLETLDIVKVIEMGCGHDVVIAAIYSAVAKKFGINCELIAFPNHLFLEFRSSQPHNRICKIELDTGKVVPKLSCPFSRNDSQSNSSSKYCPDSLLQFVISSFLMPMGSYKTWYMQNAIYLLAFLSSNPNCENNYKKYLPYLLDNTHLPIITTPIKLVSLTEEQLKLITLLSYTTKAPPPYRKEILIHKREGDIKYAIGMVVQHRVYDYLCVVKGWEYGAPPEVRAREAPALKEGPNQPFYIVVAIDQSDRYVAQEHLVDVARPSRLYHLEDIIAKEFTHFNGFAYEPNVYKQTEYPYDLNVSEQYRIRAAKLYGHGEL